MKFEKNPETIVAAIAKANNVTVEEIKGNRRVRHIADARKQAMAMLWLDTSMRLHEIERVVNCHHSTVLHAAKTHVDIMRSDRAYRMRYELAKQYLNPEQSPERRLPRQLYAGKIILHPCRA